jgi:hypothetical protein
LHSREIANILCDHCSFSRSLKNSARFGPNLWRTFRRGTKERITSAGTDAAARVGLRLTYTTEILVCNRRQAYVAGKAVLCASRLDDDTAETGNIIPGLKFRGELCTLPR